MPGEAGGGASTRTTPPPPPPSLGEPELLLLLWRAVCGCLQTFTDGSLLLLPPPPLPVGSQSGTGAALFPHMPALPGSTATTHAATPSPFGATMGGGGAIDDLFSFSASGVDLTNGLGTGAARAPLAAAGAAVTTVPMWTVAPLAGSGVARQRCLRALAAALARLAPRLSPAGLAAGVQLAARLGQVAAGGNTGGGGGGGAGGYVQEGHRQAAGAAAWELAAPLLQATAATAAAATAAAAVTAGAGDGGPALVAVAPETATALVDVLVALPLLQALEPDHGPGSHQQAGLQAQQQRRRPPQQQHDGQGDRPSEACPLSRRVLETALGTLCVRAGAVAPSTRELAVCLAAAARCGLAPPPAWLALLQCEVRSQLLLLTPAQGAVLLAAVQGLERHAGGSGGRGAAGMPAPLVAPAWADMVWREVRGRAGAAPAAGGGGGPSCGLGLGFGFSGGGVGGGVFGPQALVDPDLQELGWFADAGLLLMPPPPLPPSPSDTPQELGGQGGAGAGDGHGGREDPVGWLVQHLAVRTARQWLLPTEAAAPQAAGPGPQELVAVLAALARVAPFAGAAATAGKDAGGGATATDSAGAGADGGMVADAAATQLGGGAGWRQELLAAAVAAVLQCLGGTPALAAPAPAAQPATAELASRAGCSMEWLQLAQCTEALAALAQAAAEDEAQGNRAAAAVPTGPATAATAATAASAGSATAAAVGSAKLPDLDALVWRLQQALLEAAAAAGSRAAVATMAAAVGPGELVWLLRAEAALLRMQELWPRQAHHLPPARGLARRLLAALIAPLLRQAPLAQAAHNPASHAAAATAAAAMPPAQLLQLLAAAQHPWTAGMFDGELLAAGSSSNSSSSSSSSGRSTSRSGEAAAAGRLTVPAQAASARGVVVTALLDSLPLTTASAGARGDAAAAAAAAAALDLAVALLPAAVHALRTPADAVAALRAAADRQQRHQRQQQALQQQGQRTGRLRQADALAAAALPAALSRLLALAIPPPPHQEPGFMDVGAAAPAPAALVAPEVWCEALAALLDGVRALDPANAKAASSTSSPAAAVGAPAGPRRAATSSAAAAGYFAWPPQAFSPPPPPPPLVQLRRLWGALDRCWPLMAPGQLVRVLGLLADLHAPLSAMSSRGAAAAGGEPTAADLQALQRAVASRMADMTPTELAEAVTATARLPAAAPPCDEWLAALTTVLAAPPPPPAPLAGGLQGLRAAEALALVLACLDMKAAAPVTARDAVMVPVLPLLEQLGLALVADHGPPGPVRDAAKALRAAPDEAAAATAVAAAVAGAAAAPATPAAPSPPQPTRPLPPPPSCGELCRLLPRLAALATHPATAQAMGSAAAPMLSYLAAVGFAGAGPADLAACVSGLGRLLVLPGGHWVAALCEATRPLLLSRGTSLGEHRVVGHGCGLGATGHRDACSKGVAAHARWGWRKSLKLSLVCSMCVLQGRNYVVNHRILSAGPRDTVDDKSSP